MVHHVRKRFPSWNFLQQRTQLFPVQTNRFAHFWALADWKIHKQSVNMSYRCEHQPLHIGLSPQKDWCFFFSLHVMAMITGFLVRTMHNSSQFMLTVCNFFALCEGKTFEETEQCWNQCRLNFNIQKSSNIKVEMKFRFTMWHCRILLPIGFHRNSMKAISSCQSFDSLNRRRHTVKNGAKVPCRQSE